MADRCNALPLIAPYIANRRMCGTSTPTWNAIELSSPVVFADGVQMGELNSWHSFLPPRA